MQQNFWMDSTLCNGLPNPGVEVGKEGPIPPLQDILAEGVPFVPLNDRAQGGLGFEILNEPRPRYGEAALGPFSNLALGTGADDGEFVGLCETMLHVFPVVAQIGLQGVEGTLLTTRR